VRNNENEIYFALEVGNSLKRQPMCV